MSPSSYMIAQPDAIPQELKDLPHWVTWDPELVGDRWTKVLKNPRTGSKASSTNAATWSTIDHALKRNPSRVGFVLTKSGFLVIDLDHCVVDGIIEEWAWKIIRRIGSYAEISVSGTGVHIIIRGQLPPGRRRTGQIETYDDGRYVTVTGATIDGYATVATDDGRVAAWYADTFPQEPKPSSEPFTRAGASLATEEIIERALRADNGAKFRDYYDGGLGNKTSRSEARYALIGMLIFWTQDPAQIEDALRSSGQWNAKVEKRPELVRKEIRDQLSRYHGPIYGERPPRLSIVPAPPPVFEPGASCDDRLKIALETIELQAAEIAAAKETIAARERVIERERERRIAAEERAERLSFERSKVMEVLRARDLNPGEKLTHFGTVIELGARIANGEEQTPQGFRLPAIRIAEMTGQKVTSVRRHWNGMADRKIIQKNNVRERTDRDMLDPTSGKIATDPETGEILTATGMRDVSYIHVPESNIINLITPATDYQNPEEEKRGGRRVKCEEHPDAGTVKRWTIECAEPGCHKVLDAGETHQAPESSGAKFAPEAPVSNTVLRGHISAPETVAASPPPSHAKFERQPLITEPPPEPDPWWWQGVGS